MDGDATPKISGRQTDEMKAFTHFLLGKAELDPKERQEMLRQQLSQKLRALMVRKVGAEDELAQEARRKTIQKLQTRLSKQTEAEVSQGLQQ